MEAPRLAPPHENALQLPVSVLEPDPQPSQPRPNLTLTEEIASQTRSGTMAVVEAKYSILSPSVTFPSPGAKQINQETLEGLLRSQTSSMEWQLITLYAERERLEAELGVSEAEEVIALVRTLKTRSGSDLHEVPVTVVGESDPIQEIKIAGFEETDRAENPTNNLPISITHFTEFERESEETEQTETYAIVQETHFSETIATPSDRIRNAVRVLQIQLQEMQAGMEAQILSLYGERERLERELGLGDCIEIAAIVHSLYLQRDKLCRELGRELPVSSSPPSRFHAPQKSENRAMSTKIRGAQIASHPLYSEIQGVVEALEAQRNAQATGLTSGDAIELDAVMRSLRDHLNDIRDTEAHLITLYAERETLTERVGTADAGEVIEIVRTLETQLRELFRESERAKTSTIPRDIFLRLATLSQIERDALDFAVFGLDECGRVLSVNRAASELLNLTLDEMQGNNLFTQVASCLNNRLIYGRFREGITSGELDESTLYTLTYKVKPTNITLHLYRHPATRTNWLLMKKRG